MLVVGHTFTPHSGNSPCASHASFSLNMPKLVISQRISLMHTLNHHLALFLHACSQKKLYLSSMLHRNWSNFYNGHVLHNSCPDKMRPSLIFKSSFPSRMVVSIITVLFKESKACLTKKDQKKNKVVLMFKWLIWHSFSVLKSPLKCLINGQCWIS